MWYPFFSVPPVGMITVVLPGLDGVARLFPRQLVDEDRVGRLASARSPPAPFPSSAARRSGGVARPGRRLAAPARRRRVRRRHRRRHLRRVRRRRRALRLAGGLDRAGHQAFDLRERVVDLDLDEDLAERGRRFRRIAADAAVLVAAAGRQLVLAHVLRRSRRAFRTCRGCSRGRRSGRPGCRASW